MVAATPGVEGRNASIGSETVRARSAQSRPMSDEQGGGPWNEVTTSAGNAGRAAGGILSLDWRENESNRIPST